MRIITLEQREKDFFQRIYTLTKAGVFSELKDNQKDLIVEMFLFGAILAFAGKEQEEQYRKIVDYSTAVDEMIRLIGLNPELTDVKILTEKAYNLCHRIRSWESMGIWAPYGDGPKNDYYRDGKWQNKS